MKVLFGWFTVVVLVMAACSDDERTSTPASLDTQYLTCVQEAGVDLRFAQVVFNEDGIPWFVKTGFDVVADVHGPCLESIGGLSADLTTSSWGPISASPPQ